MNMVSRPSMIKSAVKIMQSSILRYKSMYRIWLEDEFSLQKRADLALKYQLKGIASWSRTFADSSAWTALSLDNQPITHKE